MRDGNRIKCQLLHIDACERSKMKYIKSYRRSYAFVDIDLSLGGSLHKMQGDGSNER